MGAMLLIPLALWLALYRQRPPEIVPADAPPAEFSSARAVEQLKVIAARPHPVGSPEHKAVQQYILQQLTALGLGPEVQRTTVVSRQWGVPFRAATVENIVARLRGTGQGEALMLVAHYDSVPTGPGAGDDGAAVAALLETLRAIKAGGQPLKNDLIFLFSDGEEVGLLGAKAFADEHAWAKDVRLVLNFEARGNGGPSIMFETSDRNGRLVREFVAAAPRPAFGNSFSGEIYKLLPNDTDFTIFRRSGWDGLNFAFIGGLTHYHTMLDDVAHLDERSLQHQGSYALALARHFGSLDLAQSRREDAVYFDVAGALFVLYSKTWAWPLTICVALLYSGLTVWGIRRKQLTGRALAVGVLALLLSMICAGTVVHLVWWVVRRAGGPGVLTPQGGTYHSALYMIGFVCLALACFTTINRLLGERTSALGLFVGGLFWWLVLMILTTLFLPGCSYLFTWPMLFSLIGVAATFALSGRGASAERWLPVALSCCALPGIILLTPAIYQIGIALALGLSGPLMVLVVLLLALLIPHLELMTFVSGRVAALVLLCAGLGVIVATSLFNARPSAERPAQDNLFYALNADTQTAVWASAEGRRDEWTSQFLTADARRGGLPEFFASASGQYLMGPAPLARLAAPKVELLDDAQEGDARRLRMRVSSPRQAPFISVTIESRAEVLDALVNSKGGGGEADGAGASPGSWGIRYFNLQPEGFELVLRVKSPEPLKLRVVDRSYGLPVDESVGLKEKARPPFVISSPLPFSDTTMVSKSYAF
jgi:Peptidase family M28